MLGHHRILLLLCATALTATLPAAGPLADPAPAARLGRPIALALMSDGSRLLSANRDRGRVSIIDTTRRTVVGEQRIGESLSDICVAGDLVYLTTVEELVIAKLQADTLQELRRIRIGPYAVSVQVSPDGRRVTIAHLWSRRLSILNVGSQAPPQSVDLPFAPRRQLQVPGAGKVIVADAFGGKLAVVDVAAGKVASVRDLGGHNIRGLVLGGAGRSLWLAHQRLNRFGHTVPGEIQNSNVLMNHVRKVPLAHILDPLADATRDDQLYMIGDIERGAGDPAAVAEIHDRQVLVAVAGTNEVMIGRPEKVIWTRLPVGQRPAALAVDGKRRRAYVANTFADSISVLDLQAPRVLGTITLGKMTELTSAQRGEVLFHDARLSHLAWFSCQSCHPDGHSNGRLNDNLSDGSFGTPKRVLSLLGVKDTGPWAWNGGMADLGTQVRSSLTTTMRGRQPQAAQIRDLAAFLRTLPPPPALAQARGSIDAEAVKRGRKIFSREKCTTCHVPPTYTSAKTYDVGLKDENGNTHFNPPSLRGISQAGPYFHDGRAHDLEEIFARFRHQLSRQLTRSELADLLTFLKSL